MDCGRIRHDNPTTFSLILSFESKKIVYSPTDRPTDRQIDGHNLSQKCVVTYKNIVFTDCYDCRDAWPHLKTLCSQIAMIFEMRGRIVFSDCYDYAGTHYFGDADRTLSGEVCQKWSQQSPHQHSFEAKDFYEHSLVRNGLSVSPSVRPSGHPN